MCKVPELEKTRKDGNVANTMSKEESGLEWELRGRQRSGREYLIFFHL